MHFQNPFLWALAIATPIQAHPGHDHRHEAAVRARYLQENPASLSHCAAKLRARGHVQANLKRRQELAESLQQKRGLQGLTCLKARDLDSVLGTSHESNNTSFNLETDPKELFGDDSSCILQPESTEGPYYVTGELIRRNITNGEAGVPLTLDIQIIDTSNCEPIQDVYLDLWACNATGVYGGIVARGNGNAADESNINNTAFRGIQRSDADGIVQFDTVFPGHYAGRTNHIHIMTHQDDSLTTVNDNNTLTGFVASHVGQIFFDQSLQTEVEKVEPYVSNDQRLTTNEEDMILAGEADSADPMMRYVQLGDDISDGILGWISVGIDPTATRDVQGSYYAGDASGSSDVSGSGTSEGAGGGSGSSSGEGAASASGSTSGGSRMLPAFGWMLRN